MSENILLSLCLPTNGVAEWCIPVIESIYKQNVNNELWELVVTNNGNDDEFDKIIENYCDSHKNLVYKKNKSILFDNQIESLKAARGEFLKFVNHRAVFVDGALNWMVETIRENIKTKPVIYMSNGSLKLESAFKTDSFDEFVRKLGKYASWTTGVGVWKSDFIKIASNHKYNYISPHSDILFNETCRGAYIIDDKKWFFEIDKNHSKKGKYDLYKTFIVDEPGITNDLFVKNKISKKTLMYVKKSYENLVAGFYVKFNIFKEPCSYDISNFYKYAINNYFLPHTIVLIAAKLIKTIVKKCFNRIMCIDEE